MARQNNMHGLMKRQRVSTSTSKKMHNAKWASASVSWCRNNNIDPVGPYRSSLKKTTREALLRELGMTLPATADSKRRSLQRLQHDRPCSLLRLLRPDRTDEVEWQLRRHLVPNPTDGTPSSQYRAFVWRLPATAVVVLPRQSSSAEDSICSAS
jgi:hypothetical protein